MDDPSPPAKCAVPHQLLLQQQRQRQQQQQFLLLQQYQQQIMLQQQRQQRIHREQSQGQQPKMESPHQLQELQRQHAHDQIKKPEKQHYNQHFQPSQQQSLAMSRLPSSIDANSVSSGVRSLNFLQKRMQQQVVQPLALAPQQPQPLQAVEAGGASVATVSHPFRSEEVNMIRNDASMVCIPDVEKPFFSVEDAVHRLLPFHILADYEAEEDDRILDIDTTGQVPSRLQQWDENIVTKMDELTSTFEKHVQDFNTMIQKRVAGEFRSEERLMLERALLQEEMQAQLQLRAELEVQERLNRELAEANLRMAMVVGGQARVTEASAASVSNRVGENSGFLPGVSSFGHEGGAIASGREANDQVQGKDPSVNYSKGREGAQANLHTAVPVTQIDQTRAMVPVPAPAMVSENLGVIPSSEFFGQHTYESMVGWNSICQGEHKDPSVNENRESRVGRLLGQWRDAGMLNTK